MPRSTGKHNIQNPSLANGPGCPVRRAPRVGLRGGRYLAFSWAERLAARTVKGPSCWNVTGCKGNRAGHVHIGGPRVDGLQERKLAHRLAWELANGQPAPDGLVVMHSCDNPRCVNPTHLSVGTQAENIHDSIRKGRYNCFGVQKLNAVQVREIRVLWGRGVLQKDIAARFGIARHTVSGIVHGKSWQHLDRIEQPFKPSDLTNVEPVRTVDLPVRGELLVTA